jgi:hypothetical protein
MNFQLLNNLTKKICNFLSQKKKEEEETHKKIRKNIVSQILIKIINKSFLRLCLLHDTNVIQNIVKYAINFLFINRSNDKPLKTQYS